MAMQPEKKIKEKPGDLLGSTDKGASQPLALCLRQCCTQKHKALRCSSATRERVGVRAFATLRQLLCADKAFVKNIYDALSTDFELRSLKSLTVNLRPCSGVDDRNIWVCSGVPVACS